jgi:hypothetical protein
MDFSKHYEQLMAYANSVKLDKPVVKLGINWVRLEKIEFLQIN